MSTTRCQSHRSVPWPWCHVGFADRALDPGGFPNFLAYTERARRVPSSGPDHLQLLLGPNEVSTGRFAFHPCGSGRDCTPPRSAQIWFTRVRNGIYLSKYFCSKMSSCRRVFLSKGVWPHED